MARFELDKNSFSRSLGRNFKMLIKLTHSTFDSPYYFINDTKSLTIDGNTYLPFAFDIVLPGQTDTQGTQLVMSNIQNAAANAIKSTIYTNENIYLDLFLVNVETETAEKYDAGLFEVQNVQITPQTVTANINIRHNLDVNMGTIHYYNQLFPNLYL